MSLGGQAQAENAARQIRLKCEEVLANLNDDPARDAADAVKEILSECQRVENEAKSGWY